MASTIENRTSSLSIASFFEECMQSRENPVELDAYGIPEYALVTFNSIRFPSAYSPSHIRLLEMANFGIKMLPNSIGELSGLTTLDVRRNQITSLPPTLGHLKQLTLLDISNNRLAELPASLSQLHSLRRLCANGNALTTLPNDIGELKQLQDLDVSENQLETLPQTMSNLENLTSLDISCNLFNGVPNVVRGLQNLRHLIYIPTKPASQLRELGELKQLFIPGSQEPIETSPLTKSNF